MSTRPLSSAAEELSRSVGTPPMAAFRLRGHSRLTSRWKIDPVDQSLAPMNETLVAAVFEGRSKTAARIGGCRFKDPSAPGTLSIIPRGQDSEWRVDGAVVASHVYIGHERLQNCSNQLVGGRELEIFGRANHADKKLFTIMQLINQELEHPQHHSLLFMEQALDALCLQLIRNHCTLLDFEPRLGNGLTRWKAMKVVNYMHDNIASDISLDDLSGIVGMSRFHFCSSFRRTIGIPPYEYLTRQRIKLACQLLKEHRLAIGSIAITVGYSSSSSFSAAFRRILGMTPKQYRSES